MADEKISAMTELAEAPAAGDLLVIVDVSDTTASEEGTTKKITAANLRTAAGIVYVPGSNTVLTGEQVQAALDQAEVALAELTRVYTHSGAVNAAATLTLALPAPASGMRHKYRVEIETQITATTYEYYEAIVISRNVGGTIADPVPLAEVTLPFVSAADYPVTYPIGAGGDAGKVVLTFTNSSGTNITNVKIRVTRDPEIANA